jgi:Domain of unknown function (DUF4386)
MLDITEANNFRRTATGLALIAAPLAIFVWVLLSLGVDYGEETEDLLAVIGDDPARERASALVFLVAQLLFIPAIYGLLHLVRERGTTLVHIGTVLTTLGVVGHSAFVGSQLVVVAMADPDADAREMAALYDRFNDDPAFLLISLIGFVGFFLGLLLLALGVWRARLASAWVAAAVAASLLLEFIVSNFVPYVEVIAGVLLVAGFGWIGLKTLRLSDRDWDVASYRARADQISHAP